MPTALRFGHAECLGDHATAYLAMLVADGAVEIELGTDPTDRYDRLLVMSCRVPFLGHSAIEPTWSRCVLSASVASEEREHSDLGQGAWMLDAIDWEILIWLVIAGLSGIGEMLTGTYFLIPLIVGAVAAAIAVALGAEVMWVLLIFGSVALVGFGWVLKYAAATQAEPPATTEGARRYIDARGLVTADIDSLTVGRARIGGEEWRALSQSGEPISAGARIRVIEVRGNALVVEEI